jgi:hypothetical protein
MAVVGEDLLAATSILLAVCGVALLSLAAFCRVLLSKQKTQKRSYETSPACCQVEVKNTSESECLKQSNDGDQTESAYELCKDDNNRCYLNGTDDCKPEVEVAVDDNSCRAATETSTSIEPEKPHESSKLLSIKTSGILNHGDVSFCPHHNL